MKQYKLDAAGVTDRGMKRDHNEDAWSAPPSNLSKKQLASKGRLYVVADGVGGHLAGDVASQMAIEIIQQAYYADPSPDVAASIAAAIQAASDQIGHESAARADQRGMSTTVTAAVLHGDRLVVANVGDSRAYLIPGKHSDGHGGRAIQITTDHTWVEEQVHAGIITREEAERHPQRNIITRSLGTEQRLNIDIFQEKVRSGDRVLLCSDGLSNMVTGREIGAIVRGGRNAQAIARELVELANRRGAPDNVTAVVLSVKRPVIRAGQMLATAVVLGMIAGIIAWVLSSQGDGSRGALSPVLPTSTTPSELPLTSPLSAPDANASMTSPLPTATPPGVPPTATPLPLDAAIPAPALLLPEDAATLVANEAPVFTWQWEHALDDAQEWRFVFELRQGPDNALVTRRELPLNQRGLGLTEFLLPGEYWWRLYVAGAFRRGEAVERRLTVVAPTPTPSNPR